MKDKGHESLLKDCRDLLAQVVWGWYHDYQSDLAMPKTELYNKLQAMIEKLKKGEYDN